MRCTFFLIAFLLKAHPSASQHDTASGVMPNSPVYTKGKTIDTINTKTKEPAVGVKKDTLIKKHNPNKAALRSAILPGWGQAYNHEYWKIPIVYAAIGIPVGFYIYNDHIYKITRTAYTIVVNGQTQNFSQIDRQLYTTQGVPLDAGSLQYYRNQARSGRDYALLATILAWGLNIVDATVFGHLKDFDINSDLSMQMQPSYDPTFKTTSLGFVFNLKKQRHKEAFAVR